MKNSNDLVSIITPAYNSERFIEETIESIINQTYDNWELIITDDCSTDKTWGIISEYAKKDKRIKIYRLNKNSGPGVARNFSIRKATGRFIAFCDSDDLWKPDKLLLQVNFMRKKQVALSFTNYDVIDETGGFIKEIKSPPYVDYSKMIKNDYIGCLTAMYDTKKLGKRYMPDLRKRQDWALWLDILKTTDKAYNVGSNLASYRKRNNSISSSKLNLLGFNFALYNRIEKFSYVKSTFLIIQFLYYYLIKKYKL